MIPECDRTRIIALFACMFAACVFDSLSLRAQVPDEAEKAIGGLPPHLRAYEADQLKLVEEQGARSEIERWNRMLTSREPAFNTRPNAFLMEIAKTRTRGAALDVGMGQGRNSIWLAQHGWTVTGFDPAEKAVALARETAANLGLVLKTEIRRMEDFDFGERRWDLILLSYVGGREMTEVLQRALKPGGVLVIEGFHRDATRDLTIGSARVFDTGELPALYRQLRVIRYEEPVTDADFGRAKVRLVRYCGERPAHTRIDQNRRSRMQFYDFADALAFGPLLDHVHSDSL